MLIFIKGQSPLLTSGKDNWETPDALFQPLHQTYQFVLDAAADGTNHKVPRWYGPGGEAPNALTVSWPLDEGHVWLNPPYSVGLQAKFVRKAQWEAKGKPYSVVCLLPARTDTKLFHEVILVHAKSVQFLRGRVKFKGGASCAPFPSLIVVF